MNLTSLIPGFSYVKLICYGTVVIAAGVFVWRITAWHSAYTELQGVKAQRDMVTAMLKMENDCKTPETSCVKHLEQLRLDNQNAVNAAIQAEQQKEAIARDAQQKREQAIEQQHAKELGNVTRKLNDANAQLAHDIATDDSCKKWAKERVACRIVP